MFCDTCKEAVKTGPYGRRLLFCGAYPPCAATHDREPEGQLESREDTVALLNKCLSWGGGGGLKLPRVETL